MEKETIKISLTYLVVIIFFSSLLTTYFSGDDFFHFKIALSGDIVSNFGFYPFESRGIAFYRPLFRELLYRIYYQSFGVEVIPFRLTQLAIHFVNIYLVYKLGVKLFKDKIVSLMSSLMFGVAAANVGILYYMAGGIQASGATCFVLLSILFLINGKYKSSFCFYLLALASHEISLVTTPLLILYRLFRKQSVKILIPNVLVTGLYLYLNIFVIGFSKNDPQYAVNFSIAKLINTYGWYTAWSLGLPEMTVDFVRSGLKLDMRLMAYWGKYYLVIFPLLAIVIGILVISVASRVKKLWNDKLVWLFIFWFVVGLLPVAFLPVHKKTYYLAASLPAMFYLISYVVDRVSRKLLYLFMVIFLILNYTAVRLGQRTFPAIQRGKIAKKLVNDVKDQYPTLTHGSKLLIKNDPNYPVISGSWGGSSTQAYYALNGSDALQLIYRDNSLQVYYEDIDEAIDCEDCLEFRAIIN